MTISIKFLCFICFNFLLLISSTQAYSRNPCHSNKAGQGAGVYCQKVTLPDNICSKCRLRNFRPGGTFFDCRNIYDLADIECQQELVKYAQMNPCDVLRRKYVTDFSNQYYRESLDYFVYSICEECCDCIPFGSKPVQWQYRLYSGSLLTPTRGNCPAHAVYDICKVLPEIKFIKNQWQPDFWWWPKLCPMLQQWFQTDDANNWLKKPQLKALDWKIIRFLNMFFGAAKCTAREQWEQCTRLEQAQQRL